MGANCKGLWKLPIDREKKRGQPQAGAGKAQGAGRSEYGKA